MKEAGVIVVGAAGKMGTRIIHIVKETPSIKVTRAIERSYYPALAKDVGEAVGLGKSGVPLEGTLKREGGM